MCVLNIIIFILARHCRLLTRYLTHMHLPGLSSVDQMHLLAVADTLANFSADAIDKLTLANDSELLLILHVFIYNNCYQECV